MLISAITAFASLAAGDAINTTILGFSYLLGCSVILGLALWKGTRKYSKFDMFCQVLAIVGIIFWLTLDNPNIALGATIIISELAALPMLRHAYLYPREETFSTFLIAALVAVGVLCLAPSVTFASLAVPIDLVFGNSLIAVVILVRRQSVKPKKINKAVETK